MTTPIWIEDNRGRHERRSIVTRTVTAEQMGLAGARQLAQVQRTRGYPGSAFVAENLVAPAALAAKLARFSRLLLAGACPEAINTEPKPEFDWLATSPTPEQMGAEAFLANNRQYWGIENGSHQRLDCSLLEDRLRVRERNAAAILGFLHRASISLFAAWAKGQRKGILGPCSPNPRGLTDGFVLIQAQTPSFLRDWGLPEPFVA